MYVMDVYNGDIIPTISSPTFESNEFVRPDKKYWNSLIKMNETFNENFIRSYPPGSTIKTLVCML